MLLVSACLCGDSCKYNGGHNYNEKVINYCKDKTILKICPESLGGLPIPRVPSEIVGGTAKDIFNGKAKVMSKNGDDVTEQFILGAKKVLQLIENQEIEEALLKANSPSCGKGHIYDGTFSGTLIKGNGVTAELLLNLGISIKTEKEL